MAEDEFGAVSHIEIFDLEKAETIAWQIVFPIFFNIHDLERDEDILLAQAMLEELKTSREIMDEIDRESGFL